MIGQCIMRGTLMSMRSIRKDKIRFFEQGLSDFFRKAGREHLPWRKSKITAYEVWVSEIMLQQTQVSRVITYYVRFIERFPTVQDLAKASWEEFLPYYEGLGYYSRGRNMLKAAQVVVSQYQGTFPRDKKLLEQLPGVGPYTASAIMSFAYGENHLAWDTNLKRVIGRFFYGGKHLVSDEAFWEDAFLFPKKEMNAALMDFGSALCVARPKCEACIFKSRCLYYQEGGKQEQKTKKKTVRSKKSLLAGQEALVHLFLHERHQKYFSATQKKFTPFVLPKGCTSRAHIKKYFLEQYGLTLAVRPPHAHIMIAGKSILLVNAQILLGEPKFTSFPKNAVAEYNTGKK
jgi:A/G-specific adenine glycosylase